MATLAGYSLPSMYDQTSMSSQKTTIVKYLFQKHWDGSKLEKTLMSLDDVAEAIRECNRNQGTDLSDRNPANFLKDLLRGTNASEHWPEALVREKYTAVQRTGTGECFEFIPFSAGQTEAFPEEFPVCLEAVRYPVQSISIPLVTKTLGRADESWLIQTAINLRVVETHFAVAAAFPLAELDHLQMGVKLRSTEIDALFLGKKIHSGTVESVIVTCEAKQARDPLIPSQIINQVIAAFSETEVDTVVPIGLRTVKGCGYYLTEFQAVGRGDLTSFDKLELASDAIYELKPPVKGI